jgi:ribosome maturation factor RimP
MDLEQVVTPVVEAAGMELVDVTFRREHGGKILRVLIDKEGGVDLEAISTVSQRLSRRLDLEGFDPGPYSLEVSSPGLERPLRRPADFHKRIGEKVKVRTTRPLEEARTHVGPIAAADEESVTVRTDRGDRRIPFDLMESARTVFEWESGR